MTRSQLGHAYLFCGLILLTASMLLQSIAQSGGRADLVFVAATGTSVALASTLLGTGALLFRQRSFLITMVDASGHRTDRLRQVGLTFAKVALFSGLVLVMVSLFLVFTQGDVTASEWIRHRAYCVFLLLIVVATLLDLFIVRTDVGGSR